ncbi:MAG: hypothetical protein JXB32_11245, partial [Deltaproteobacteria bacterium]|nr:hypothetical protein [Deltaproteobacteria bacterium]
MTREARRRFVRLVVRRRMGLFVATTLLALVVPFIASTPVRAIPTVAAAVGAPDGVSLGAVVPGGGETRLGLGPLLGLLLGVGVFAAL